MISYAPAFLLAIENSLYFICKQLYNYLESDPLTHPTSIITLNRQSALLIPQSYRSCPTDSIPTLLSQSSPSTPCPLSAFLVAT